MQADDIQKAVKLQHHVAYVIMQNRTRNMKKL